jgi:anion-transporting  ArsA/GET3 family ATPase
MDMICRMDEYDDEQRDAHVNTIKTAISVYEKNGQLTEDLMEECRDLILSYNVNVFDIETVKRNSSSKYLKLYMETNVIVDFIRSLDRANVEFKYYYLFCKNLELMRCILKDPVDELSSMMSAISLKTNSRKLRQ